MNHLARAQSNVHKKESGVALLFVVLLTSVLMLVAIGIADVSFNEASFSVEAKNSDRAFFAADTGIECGLYLDGENLFGGGGTASPSCANYTPDLALSSGGTYVFAIPLGTACSEISVDKSFIASDGSGPYTQISAVGYDMPADPSALPSACVAPTDTNPNLVTRALRTEYLNAGGSATGTGTTGTGTTGSGPTVPTSTVTVESDGLLGVITADGGSSILDEGFDFSIVPTTAGVTAPFTGSYATHIDIGYPLSVGEDFSTSGTTSLLPVSSCSTVYARTWATNGLGTGYGSQEFSNVGC